MSFRVVAKVLRYSEETHSRRLILIVIAETAHDDGVAFLKQSTIAEKARLSRSHVAERVSEMEADGVLEIRKAQRGNEKVNVYRVMLPGLDEVDYDRLPFGLDEPFTVSEVPTESEPPTVSEVPTGSDPDRVGSSGDTVSDLARKSEASPLVEPPGGTSLSTGAVELVGRVPKKVDRRASTKAERELAAAVLDEWNRQTGQRLRSSDWLSKMVMRIRDRPELDLDGHAAVIAAALADPWWRGPASPSVVYGNGAIFEKSIAVLEAPPTDDRRMTTPTGAPTASALVEEAERLREQGR